MDDGTVTPDSRAASIGRAPRRTALAAVGVCVLGVGLVVFIWLEAVNTAPVRDAVRVYSQVVGAANRGDLPAVERLCTPRLLSDQAPRLAEEGGIVGLPRAIHKNFRAWRQGSDVWITPNDARSVIRPVYRIERLGDTWKYDGLIGHLRRGTEFLPAR